MVIWNPVRRRFPHVRWQPRVPALPHYDGWLWASGRLWPREAPTPTPQTGFLLAARSPLPWSDWWVAATVLVVGLSLAYIPYIFQTHDGGLPPPSVRLVGLVLAMVALVLMADGLLGLPLRLATTARLLVPVLLVVVIAFIGVPSVFLVQTIAVATVLAVLILGPRLHARGINVFLLAAAVQTPLIGLLFIFYRPNDGAAEIVPWAPVLTGIQLVLVSVLLLLLLAGRVPVRLVGAIYLLAGLAWVSAALVLLQGGFMVAGESAAVLALALAVAPLAPTVRRDRALGDVLVLGMVFAAMIPLVAVCSLGTMAWQISEERSTETLHGLLVGNGARSAAAYVQQGAEVLEGLRWRDDMVDAVQQWNEARLARILAATLQATEALSGLVVLDPANRVRARFGTSGLQLGDPFPDPDLLAAARDAPRAQTSLGPVLGDAGAVSAAVAVALRQPDGTPAALIIGTLPTSKLAEAAGVRRLGATGAVVLIDRRHHRILAHPDRRLIGASPETLPQIATLRTLEEHANGTTDRSGPWLITRRAVRGIPWEVIAVQDIRGALEPVHQLGAQALAATGIFAVLLGAIGIAVGRRLVRPVSALELLAFQDPLTGLATRRFFVAWLIQALELARRYQQPLSLIFLDLDNFKQINDRYGHLVGDRVLQEVAARIRRGLRASDLVVRYGGEEIIVALPQTSKQAALTVADGLRRAVAASPVAWDARGQPITVTVSAGVAAAPDDATDAEGLLERTDAALYHAKAQGRDRVAPA